MVTALNNTEYALNTSPKITAIQTEKSPTVNSASSQQYEYKHFWYFRGERTTTTGRIQQVMRGYHEVKVSYSAAHFQRAGDIWWSEHQTTGYI